MNIPFNKPVVLGTESKFIQMAFKSGKISGDGEISRWCEAFIEKRYGCPKALLTTSCTSALEMAAILLDIKPGDEVILPSYTFVSTVNAFLLRGAVPVFCDIDAETLNLDTQLLEDLINEKTKTIVPVHYAGNTCDMTMLLRIARKYDIPVVEDAAQAIEAKYQGKYCGTMGDIGCYSFHETKNISMGEGGAILVNKNALIERAEIVREKGTNRKMFFKGLVDKYTWVDIGSSYLPSEISAAVLKSNFLEIDKIQAKREYICRRYYQGLKEIASSNNIKLNENNINYHMFYMIVRNESERNDIIRYLNNKGIKAVFHYIPLHTSPYFQNNYNSISLPVTEEISGKIVRLPLYTTLSDVQINYVITSVNNYFKGR